MLRSGRLELDSVGWLFRTAVVWCGTVYHCSDVAEAVGVAPHGMASRLRASSPPAAGIKKRCLGGAELIASFFVGHDHGTLCVFRAVLVFFMSFIPTKGV